MSFLALTLNQASNNVDHYYGESDGILDETLINSFTSKLNKSQTEAVLACLRMMHCKKKSPLELIWGPPGTGKTKTISALLVSLLKMNYRTLICAPTNVAITEVASRVLRMVLDAECDPLSFSLGDILLFGNKDRLKIGLDIQEIYLNYRIERLAQCLGPLGLKHYLTSMINFLEDPQYHIYKENELNRYREQSNGSETDSSELELKSFIEYVRERFVSITLPLRNCISIFCTHMAKSFISECSFQSMVSLMGLLDCFKMLLFQDEVVSDALEEMFSQPIMTEDVSDSCLDNMSLLTVRSACVSVLRTLHGSLNALKLPSFSYQTLMKFCFQRASLIFCTASSSFKLHRMEIKPLSVLVIDEAAQLKECESTIPLQIKGIEHAVLVGDEFQLPATVKSKIADEAGFGRSLFERLSSLNHPKHLLNVQYRMHPSISFFPNSKFYNEQILDAPMVRKRSYERHYLPGRMFGTYSFINVVGGREEKDDDSPSRKNMVEVAIISKILQNLYKAWLESPCEISIGVVSPYSAQVVAIKDKLGTKYEKIDGFLVKVKTVDGFQGGEQDIIIISTVRSYINQSLDFISKPQRINVALTRARHCLWILGNEKALTSSQSIWEALVVDAKNRQCFFNADADEDLAKAILKAKKELSQLDDLLNADSILFKSSKWKVLFSDNFLKSFKTLKSVRKKQSILNLLLRLSSGWRPKRPTGDSISGSSLQIMKFKVEELFVVSTIDIVKDLKHMQVLKIWDVLSPEDSPKLVKRLDSIFVKYTDDFISLCNEKYFEGNLQIPKSWPPSFDIVRFTDLTSNETDSALAGAASDSRSYVENSKVSESLLLMKFYALSHGVVSHLLSDRDGRELDLPFEVTDQEMQIILYDRSTFILGRSGTGKTTILTMKLYKKEQLYHTATEGVYGEKDNTVGHVNENVVVREQSPVLRQLFVTVSPKLCNAVKQHVSNLKSFACGRSHSAESSSTVVDDIDDEESQFKNIPDSFLDISSNSYPLVITFHKFLMMLDGTLSNSYFERFLGATNLSYDQGRSSRSVALQTFLRTKEVNYERFCLSYWPHFNSQITKKLDPSRVFTEIISHIKGSLEASEGKLSREDYVTLAEGRVSNLNRKKRDMVYDLYQSYEKMKMDNGEYDLADFVNNLHRRLRQERYEGDKMDFVYIDEVQDLTMSQIALFKHICNNVEEGFVFSGDTAQTIARGIDFRFQDIRSLFYKKFVLQSNFEQNERQEKGRLSEIFHLTQNFRTHAGILKLSQSVIDLLFHFFPQSVDVLEPETSLIYGEAPILLQCGNDENAIVKIFGNNQSAGGNMVGFGAEQVILVRDDSARKEISDYVGKQALVLTILECKGLEFQDVLLYNFFGSSQLKNKWRVIYKYMKEQDMCHSTLTGVPNFDESKHNILCSELKQLYVAVTRTRQRLWICENTEFFKPMFDYWMEQHLVQVRQLDDSLAQAMQVASTPEEWRSRGIKLYYEHNYEMATMCFERAGDTHWERMSKASGLKAMSEKIRISNPEEANSILREAAEIFEAIGKAESAARCFSELGEYERAGRIYLERFGDSELKRAGECFSLGGCHELAAEVYAKGNFFSECLSACAKGKLFEIGLGYIQYWKQQAKTESILETRNRDIEKIEQEFLESRALHYYEAKDYRSMVKFVKAFNSMDSIRNFLRPLGCFDELLLLEEEAGNFEEAASIAKLKGDMLRVIDLLEKAGNFEEAASIAKLKGDMLLVVDLLEKAQKFKEAVNLILFYVLASSAWSNGRKGWPLSLFKQRDELLRKAKLFAIYVEDDNFYEFVCIEAEILKNESSDLVMTMNQMVASRRHKSVRGEILSARRILENHFSKKPEKFLYEGELISDLSTHLEKTNSNSLVSVESLVYFWNFWKERIVNIFESLGHLETQDVNEFRDYGEFCLNFLGVWRQFHNLNPKYVLLNSDAHWARDVDKSSFGNNGQKVSIDVRQFVSAAGKYWSSEVFSVGIKVLDKLKALFTFPAQASDVEFSQSRILTLVYEVAIFLLESKFLRQSNHDRENLWKFIKLSTDNFVPYIFPLNWQKSLRENMVFLRITDSSKNLLKQVIVEQANSRSSYRQIGTIAMIVLGSGELNNELCKEVVKGRNWNPPWEEFFNNLLNTRGSEMALMMSFHKALTDVYNANWRMDDYITPGCFLYLAEHLLMWVSSAQGYSFTTKSVFVEWLMYQDKYKKAVSSFNLGPDTRKFLFGVAQFIVTGLQGFLLNKWEMMEWIKKSTPNVKEQDACYSLLVIRMILIICLVHANFNNCIGLIYDVLKRDYVSEQVPRHFVEVLWRRRNHHFPSVLAEAFKKIGNPLVIVNLGGNCPKLSSPDVVFVDMKVSQCKNNILKTLFPKIVKASKGSVGADAAIEVDQSCKEVVSVTVSDSVESSKLLPSSKIESVADQNKSHSEQPLGYNNFWNLFEDFHRMKSESERNQMIFISNAKRIKVMYISCVIV
ncbi:hypothetical protein UlMin_041469 [Ulmus minor]